MENDWLVLNIDKKKMTAGLAKKEVEGEESPDFSAEFILKFLQDNGITYGIKKETVQMFAEYAESGQEVVVAEGKEPVKGVDGYYDFVVSLEDAKSNPVVNQDGSVDYYNSLKLAMVEENQLLATYVAPTAGEEGYNIFSEPLPPIRGREPRELRGKGFVCDEEKKEYRAECTGHIYKEGERIIIEPIYKVNGDVDVERGNIQFNGDVEIMGDVRSGFSIVAEGSIVIHGHVGACHLTAGKNITVIQGAQGRARGEMHAGGDVNCSFVERCTIIAGGNIYADSVLDCKLVAKGRVIVTSKRGLILGGSVTGMQGIEAKEAGNDVGIVTVLKMGATRDFVKRLAELKMTRKRVVEDIHILDKNLKKYDAIPEERRTKESEEIRMKIFRAKVIKTTELKSIRDEIQMILSEIEQAKKEAMVAISGLVYPGVKIHMGEEAHAVADICKGVAFRLKENGIVMQGLND